jgi:hypothetical protein
VKKRLSFVMSIAAAAAALGCGYERESTVGPTATGIMALLGTWTSTNLVPSPGGGCSDFQWNATQQSGNTASGAFSATCTGGLRVTGSANGTLTGSTVAWNAQATASLPNLPSCPVTLSGTAELAVDSIRVPYSGDTCLGRVTGVEVMRKN